MFNTFDFDEADPSEKNKIFELDNGVVINARQTDPFGFWSLSYQKGALPDALKGQFTTFEQAKNSVRDYCNINGHKIVFIKGKTDPKFEEGSSEKDIYNPPKPRFKKTHDSISLDNT